MKTHFLRGQPFVIRAAEKELSVVDYSSLLSSSLPLTSKVRA